MPPSIVDHLAIQLYTTDLPRLRQFYVDVLGFGIHSGSSSHAVLDIPTSSPGTPASGTTASSTTAVIANAASSPPRVRLSVAVEEYERLSIGRSCFCMQLKRGLNDAAILSYRSCIVTELARYMAQHPPPPAIGEVTTAGVDTRPIATVSEWSVRGIGLGLFTVVDPDGNRIVIRQDRTTYSG